MMELAEQNISTAIQFDWILYSRDNMSTSNKYSHEILNVVLFNHAPSYLKKMAEQAAGDCGEVKVKV